MTYQTKPTIADHIAYLRQYQAWRTGEDPRTIDEAGIVPSKVSAALVAVLDFAENHIALPAGPTGDQSE